MASYVLPQDRGPGHDYRMQNIPGYADSVNSNVSLPETMKGQSAPNSALTVPQVEGVQDSLAINNNDWLSDQAQRMMDFQTNANRIAMEFSSAEADKERAFQMEMANTAYQRAVADMKKAGLNPILAYSQGGASVPSVNAPSGVSSSGAMASSMDYGYTSRQLNLEEKKLAVNSALSIVQMLLSLVPSSGSKTGKIGF